MNREKSIDRLYDAIIGGNSIECSKCRKMFSEASVDEKIVAEMCHEYGWRGAPSNIYCPECANKYLKSK